MTREEFVKKKFTAYMSIDWVQPSSGNLIECMLVGIDFDEEILQLTPFDKDSFSSSIYYVNISHCEIPKPKPKAAK